VVKTGTFNPTIAIQSAIDSLLTELQALSLIVDFAFDCRQIDFIVPPGQVDSGPVWIAKRLPLTRGLAFEVDEREIADRKLQQGLAPFAPTSMQPLERAIGYYLTGLKLLALEDQVEGLIDAAFMQFYLALEVLLGTEKPAEAMQYFAKSFSLPESICVQRVIHQVYAVRGRYFGHANAAPAQTAQQAFDVAKQVLVARWLARRLIDLHAGRQETLAREMRLYRGYGSVEFRGTEVELRTDFRLDTVPDPFAARVYDALGVPVKGT
jgi:hypothetical protein